MNAHNEQQWPEYLMLRDTGLYDDAGGLGQHIFTTAGAGYVKQKYVRADLAAQPSPVVKQNLTTQPAAAQEAVAWRDDAGNLYPDKESVDKYLPRGRTAHALYAAPVIAAPAELIERCKEILAWQRTGVLPGDALRAYANARWPDEHDPLQIAEKETAREALRILAKAAAASTPAAPGIDLLGELVAAIKSYRLSASTTNRASIERLDDVLSRIDASPKGEDSIARAFDRAVLEPMRREAKADSPKGGSEAPQNGEVLVTVSGLTGSGKSAVAGEIEILCKALGLEVEWTNGDEEKYLTHADWTEALELYKPRVRIVEVNIPRVQAGDAEVQP